MYKKFNNYLLCEEEFITSLGSNVRAVAIDDKKKFKEHLSLFILDSEFSKDPKKNEAFQAFFEYEMDNIMLIQDPWFINLNRVEKVDDHWVFIKEYAPGLRLSNIIYKENSPRMNLNVALYVFNEICEGVNSILGLLSNDGRVSHCMIHPFNIFITEKGKIKLDNYFFGKVLSEIDIKSDDFTEYYGSCMPVNEKKLIQFGPQSDLIQLGMLFLELLNGMEIPRDISLSETEEIVEKSKTVRASSGEALTDEDIKGFLKKMLQLAPEGNFSGIEEMVQSAKPNFKEPKKHKSSREEFRTFFSTYFKLDLLSLTNILRSEKLRDYRDWAEELPKAKEEIKTGKQIVIIEDDKITLKILEKAVTQLGFEVFTAQDGAEGYELVQRIKPDLLISDLLIPKIHGIDLCKKVKTNESLKEIPIILMSAVYKGSKYMPQIMETDADYFLEKPIDINKLKTIINKII